MISIMDHGAIPETTTDNTAAIQAALNAAAVSTETRTVVVPPGAWGTLQVRVPAGVTLIGDGGTLFHRPEATAKACVDVYGADATIEKLGIDGNRASQSFATQGILIQGDRANVERVKVKQTADTGILISGRTGHRIDRVHVQDTGKNGVGCTIPGSGIVASDFVISNALIERTNDGGISATGKSFTVEGCTTRGTGGDGITAYADENEDYSITGNILSGVGNNGIHSAGSGAIIEGNEIKGCINRGIYHLSKTLMLQDGVIISLNHVRTTGMSGYEVWPAKNVSMLGNVMIDTQDSAFNIRQTDGLSLFGNIAERVKRHAFLFMAVRHVAGGGNVGTGITGDLIRIDDGAILPTSMNGIFAANVGNQVAGALNIMGNAGWFREFATLPGMTGPTPYAMGSETNRRI